jgi:Ca2+-binding RTX toxin-like protein
LGENEFFVGINGTGNELDNVLTGNGAVNVLSGFAGNDTLYGQGGNDTLLGGDGNDNLWGSDGNDNLWGDAGNDKLLGGAGNDILHGNTGADSMTGGTGNDTYFVDNTGDRVIEAAGAGTDSVSSAITYTLLDNFENLTLVGTAAMNGTGNGLANVITGNGAKNALSGLAGADTLVGGANADVLIGGFGPDRFDFNFVSDSTTTARDAIRAGGGALAFEGAGVDGGDRIDLSGIDANTSMAGNQAFGLGGTGIGRISLVNSGTTTLVRGNVDADATFEFVLAIEDGSALASAYKAVDFIL